MMRERTGGSAPVLSQFQAVTMLSSIVRIRGKQKYSGSADEIHCSPHILSLGGCVIGTMVYRVLHRDILSKLKLPAASRRRTIASDSAIGFC